MLRMTPGMQPTALGRGWHMALATLAALVEAGAA
jgi:hypothetical protein